jgi:hypothetical protein
MTAGDHESSSQRQRFAAGVSEDGRQRGTLIRPGSAPPRAGTMTGHKRSGDGSDAGADLEELSDVFEDEGEEDDDDDDVIVSEGGSMSGKYDKMIVEDMLIADLYEDVQEANRQLFTMEGRHESAMDVVQVMIASLLPAHSMYGFFVRGHGRLTVSHPASLRVGCG